MFSAFVGLGTASPAFAEAMFMGLGDQPSGGSLNWVGVSADGSVVVGASNDEAFRWTSDGGMVGLGFLSGGPDSRAMATSADGSVVVGVGWSLDADFPPVEAFRWTSDGGMVGLGFLPPGAIAWSWAFGVSADGSVVVGQAGEIAFRWTADGGMVGLGHLPSGGLGGYSEAYATSADGSVVVGGSSPGWEAFHWTSDGGMVGLGHLPGGGFDSRAFAASADGSVVVGRSDSASGDEAFRWTSDGGMVGLGHLPGGGFDSRAFAASADGSVVVGRSDSASGDEAFIWDSTNGMRALAQVLTDLGIDLTGWTVTEATGASGDGLTIVGYGTNPSGDNEAWIAVLPASTIAVEIDIKPGNDLNPINPKSRGVIPVAILSSDTFDVADVDATTLAFGPNGAGMAHQGGPHLMDANNDGVDDLLAHFLTKDSGIAFGDEEACVTGELFDATPFEGCDTIATEPPCGRGFEAALLLPPMLWARRRLRRRTACHVGHDSMTETEGGVVRGGTGLCGSE
jgi:probable HAF family extracellular repeat protein